ncbi:MAG: macro domain-containing protein, partial [Planctomycetota bacterium]
MIELKPFRNSTQAITMRITFCDAEPRIAAAIAARFLGVNDVEVLTGDLLQLKVDAIVSPANSFGDMSGGIEKAIDDRFNGEAQRRIVARIRAEFLGELPVGRAVIEQMPDCQFIVVSPTMRTPTDVSHTINAYLAMRAAFVALQKHNENSLEPIQTVAIPGLCTGVGRMSPQDSASQMRAAYD